MLILLTLFAFKHFIVDFPMQGPYMYLNKGTLGHPGGLLHAGLHALASAGIIAWFCGTKTDLIELGALLVGGEFVAHYLIDYTKMNINRKMGWKADNSEYFWMLLGFDQLLHSLTYLVMVAYMVGQF